MSGIRDTFRDFLDYVNEDLLDHLRTGEDIERRGTPAVIEVVYVEDGQESPAETWNVRIPFLKSPAAEFEDPWNWLDQANVKSRLRQSVRGYEGEAVKVKFLECAQYPELRNRTVEWIEEQ